MTFTGRVARWAKREAKKSIKLRRARQMGLVFVKPNYLHFPLRNSGATIVDVGCGYDADFSISMINLYGAKAYAVDPTRKHQSGLEELERRNIGRLKYLPYAVTAVDRDLVFYESVSNESGSIRNDHINVSAGETTSYSVKGVTLRSLIEDVGLEKVDLLKLDIEGAEYELLDNVDGCDLEPFSQIFIEFHHHAVPKFTIADNFKAVEKLRGFGFQSFSVDDHNFIFFRNAP
jgi:FkbM family methyltransferase